MRFKDVEELKIGDIIKNSYFGDYYLILSFTFYNSNFDCYKLKAFGKKIEYLEISQYYCNNFFEKIIVNEN